MRLVATDALRIFWNRRVQFFCLNSVVAGFTRSRCWFQVFSLRQKVVALQTVDKRHFAVPFHFIWMTSGATVDRANELVKPFHVTFQAIDASFFKMDFVSGGVSDQFPLCVLAQVALCADFLIEIGMVHDRLWLFGDIHPDLVKTLPFGLFVAFMTAHHVMGALLPFFEGFIHGMTRLAKTGIMFHVIVAFIGTHGEEGYKDNNRDQYYFKFFGNLSDFSSHHKYFGLLEQRFASYH